MIRQCERKGFTRRYLPIALGVLCCLLHLAACATTSSTPAVKKASPCESATAPRQVEPQKNEYRPIETCKEPDRDEVKGKANGQDDKILY